ncbi:MAG: hypothetical protein QOF98_3430, partial [Streptomyces sp.]|nr:hypothetical protein [Streptomyces sp.]
GTPDAGFGTDGVVEYPVDSVNGSGTAASLTNITVTGGGGAKDDFSDIILSGFSYAKGLKQTGKATGLTVAINERSGDLDTAFNGTGELINADYGDAILAHVVTNRDGTASELDIVYGTVGTAESAFVEYPISGGVVDLANPADTQTGILSGPADFAATQGYTTNKKGQFIVSGNTTSGGQQLITIDASRALGS